MDSGDIIWKLNLNSGNIVWKLNLNSYQHNMKKEIKYEFRNSRFRLQLVLADYSLQTQGAPSRSNRWCKDILNIRYLDSLISSIPRYPRYPKSQYLISQYPISRYPISRYPISQYPISWYPISWYPISWYLDPTGGAKISSKLSWILTIGKHSFQNYMCIYDLSFTLS